MLLCITDLDSRVDGVVVVKKFVVVESGGVPQVTLKFPPRPPFSLNLTHWLKLSVMFPDICSAFTISMSFTPTLNVEDTA